MKISILHEEKVIARSFPDRSPDVQPSHKFLRLACVTNQRLLRSRSLLLFAAVGAKPSLKHTPKHLNF